METEPTQKEVVGFYGNMGAGKSALLNAILGALFFASGLSTAGLTKERREREHNGTLYIDTPGLSDPVRREAATKEIEASLRNSKHYKIIFVIAPISGRISPADMETINTICRAITVPFTYGLIINKLTPNAMKLLEGSSELKHILSLLDQAPAHYLMLPRVDALDDAVDVLLEDEAIRSKLVNFIKGLKANLILSKDVNSLDTRSYEQKAADFEIQMKEVVERAAKEKKESDERWAKAIQSVEQEVKEEKGATIQRKVDEKRSFNKWQNRWSIYDVYQNSIPFTKYQRNKTTRNNGAVEFSDWVVLITGETPTGSRYDGPLRR